MFRIGLQFTNIFIGSATIIGGEVYNKIISDLTKEIEGIQIQLADVGVDLAKGAEFFKKIVDEGAKVDWNMARLEMITNQQIATIMQTIQKDAKDLQSQLNGIPVADSDDGQGGSSFWTDALRYGGLSLSIVMVLFEGHQFHKGLKKYRATRANANNGNQAAIDLIELPGRATGNKRTERRQTIADDHMSTGKGAGGKPNITIPASDVTAAKPGFGARAKGLIKTYGFDAISFVFGVVSLVMIFVNGAKTVKQLEEQLPKMKQSLAEARERLKDVTADEVAFYRDMPQTFLALSGVADEVTTIASLATTVKIGSGQATDDELKRLTDEAKKLMPFTETELDDIQATVVLIEEIEEKVPTIEVTNNKGEKIKKKQYTEKHLADINALFEQIFKKYSQDRFADAFKQIAAAVDALNEVLKTAFQDLNDIALVNQVISVVTALAMANTALSVLSLTVSAMSKREVTKETLLTIIANHTPYTGATYEGNDLAPYKRNYTKLTKATTDEMKIKYEQGSEQA